MRSLFLSAALGLGSLVGLGVSADSARACEPVGGYAAGGFAAGGYATGGYAAGGYVAGARGYVGPVVPGYIRAGRGTVVGPGGVRNFGGVATPRLRAGYYGGPRFQGAGVGVRPRPYVAPY